MAKIAQLQRKRREQFANIIVEVTAMRVLEVLVIGALTLVGGFWQMHLLMKDRARWKKRRLPKRVYAPMVLGFTIFLGAVVLGTFWFWDPRRTLPDKGLICLGWVARGFVLWVVLVLKSWWGPLFLVVGFSWGFYSLCEFNELQWFPLVDSVFQWMFNSTEADAGLIYLVLIACYALGGSVMDSWSQG